MRLRPVTFHYKPQYDDGQRVLQYGLIAEEVAAVNPGLVQYDDDGKPLTVRYHFVYAMLVNEAQKQHFTIADQAARLSAQTAAIAAQDAESSRQRAEIASQQSEIVSQRSRLDQLEARLARLEAGETASQGVDAAPRRIIPENRSTKEPINPGTYRMKKANN